MTKWDYWLLAGALGWTIFYVVSIFTGLMHYRMEYWEQQLIAISVGIVIGKASHIWLRN